MTLRRAIKTCSFSNYNFTKVRHKTDFWNNSQELPPRPHPGATPSLVILQSHASHGATTRTTADFHQFGFTSETVPYLGFQKNIWKHLEMFEVSEWQTLCSITDVNIMHVAWGDGGEVGTCSSEWPDRGWCWHPPPPTRVSFTTGGSEWEHGLAWVSGGGRV